MKKDKIILKSFIGCLLAIILILIITLSYDRIFNFETITHKDKFVGAGQVKNYPLNSNILCESGIVVNRYEYLGHITLYSCLLMDDNYMCSGFGKICLIEYKERVRKNELDDPVGDKIVSKTLKGIREI